MKYEPRAKTPWHTHSTEPALLVTERHGFYPEKGSPAGKISKGDTTAIPPGAEHGHGAAPNSMFTHSRYNNKDG